MEPIKVEEAIQTDDEIKTIIKTEDVSSEDITESESLSKTNDSLDIKSEEEDETEVSDSLDSEAQVEDENIKFEIKTEGVDRNKVFSGLTWPSTWDDGPRRSAFQPYKPATVLTNLQRGNIQTKTPQSDTGGFTWYERAGRGDITEKDVSKVHDINAVDLHGYSALMWSAAYGQNNAVLLLLESGADVHIRGKKLETAMHLAASGGHQEVIRHLITFGAEPDIFDDDGNTPLMYAVHGDHPYAVQELLQEGASMFDPDCYNYAVLKECLQAQFVMEKHFRNMLLSEDSS